MKDKSDSIRFAYAAIGWIKPTDEEPVRPVAVAEVVHMLRDTGLDGIEGFGLAEMLPKDANLASTLKAARMSFCGAYASGSFVVLDPNRVAHERAKLKRSVTKIAELGGSTVSVGGGRIYEGRRELDWPIFIKTIRHLAEIAHDAGVRFGFHPHKGTLVFTPEEIDRFLKDTEDAAQIVGLTLDTAHVAIGGGDVLRVFERYHSRTVHIHLKDVKKDQAAAGYTENDSFAPLGRGSLPIKEIIAEASNRGYRGWMTVELDASRDALGDAKLSLANLKRWLDELSIPTRLRELT